MRVAIVHDWLLGMRGGEKCLEVFCELFPKADLYTLIYAPDGVSSIIRRMKIHTSWVNRMPWVGRTYRYYLPLFPRIIKPFDNTREQGQVITIRPSHPRHSVHPRSMNFHPPND